MEGIENLSNLTCIFGYGCGVLSDVSSIKGLSNLTLVDLTHSPVADVSVFSGLVQLTKLCLNAMVAPSDTDVQSALISTGISINLTTFSINQKYAYLFAAIQPRIDLSYSYLGKYINSSSQEFITIKNRTNVTGLNLSGQTDLTDDDLQSTLKTMTGLQYLSLRNVNLKSFEFLENVKDFIELDLRGCKFAIDEETGMADLSELNNSCSKLLNFFIDDNNVDLRLIEDAICEIHNHYSERAISGSWVSDSAVTRGMTTCGATFNWDKITKLTQFNTRSSVISYSKDYIIDLSNCENLTKIYVGYSDKIILPPNVETYNIWGTYFDMSHVKNVSKLVLQPSDSGDVALADDVLNTFPKTIPLKEINFQRYTYQDLSFLRLFDLTELTTLACRGGNNYTLYTSNLRNLSIKNGDVNVKINAPLLRTLDLRMALQLTDITELSNFNTVDNLNISYCPSLQNINGVNQCTGLKTLTANDCSINDISYLSACTGLQYLYLANNKIGDISVLSNLKGIRGLTLNNNPISDISPLLGLIGDDGKIKFSSLDLSNCSLVAKTTSGVDNIDVLRQLHTAGLTKVTITGNTALTDTTKAECLAYIAELQEIFGTGLIYQ